MWAGITAGDSAHTYVTWPRAVSQSVSSDICKGSLCLTLGRDQAEPSERGSSLCLASAGIVKARSKSWRDSVRVRVGGVGGWPHPSCLCPQRTGTESPTRKVCIWLFEPSGLLANHIQESGIPTSRT